MSVVRKVFALEVPSASLPEYERRHREMDAEMRAEILGNGARSLSLFAAPELGVVIMCVELEDLDRWADSAVSEVTARWWAHMADIMPTNPDNSPISTELPLVFELDRSTGGSEPAPDMIDPTRR